MVRLCLEPGINFKVSCNSVIELEILFVLRRSVIGLLHGFAVVVCLVVPLMFSFNHRLLGFF